MQFKNRISIDSGIMVGKPVIKGTRITVELILRRLAAGESPKDIIQHYPHLTKEDVAAAIAYAREMIEEQQIYPLVPTRHGKETKALAR